MSHRRLALVSGLTLGDYLLWNWSLGGSHDALAIASGLSLPPLALAWVWMLALTAARALAATRGRRAAVEPLNSRPRAARVGAVRADALRHEGAVGQGSSPPASAASSRKLAA